MTNRRRFLYYVAGSSLTVLGLSSWRSPSNALDLDTFCVKYPYNSRCEGFLPGERAIAPDGEPYDLDSLLTEYSAGARVPAEGLENLTYLVITDGPALASYGISAKCTHLGCTVDWQPDQQAFVCPCHGSRFNEVGEVLNGPADDPLRLVTVVTEDDQIGLLPQPPETTPR